MSPRLKSYCFSDFSRGAPTRGSAQPAGAAGHCLLNLSHERRGFAASLPALSRNFKESVAAKPRASVGFGE